MDRAIGVRPRARRAPLGERGDGGAEAPAGLGQGVAHAQRPALVGGRRDEGQALQRAQAGGEDRRGDAVDLAGELAERAVAVEQGADDAQAPAVADAAGGGVEGVGA